MSVYVSDIRCFCGTETYLSRITDIIYIQFCKCVYRSQRSVLLDYLSLSISYCVEYPQFVYMSVSVSFRRFVNIVLCESISLSILQHLIASITCRKTARRERTRERFLLGIIVR